MTPWCTPACTPVLGDDELHVWKASLTQLAPHLPALRAVLQATELERAARFHFEIDRQRHLVSRGLVRTLAGHYLGRPPAALRFGIGTYGKPHLSDDDGRLAFNLSHSGDVVLIAMARSGSVGVDVERWSQRLDEHGLTRLAESAFSATERAGLRLLDPAERRAAFFAVWSRKEAYIKATGRGVSSGLGHFDVSSDSADARLLSDRNDEAAVGTWTLRDLALGPGYSGAVVFDNHRLNVMQFNAELVVLNCASLGDR